eukprot:TRINITY_DN108032_c0_g1_i1.p1 TRINITY_DN108032_c0_g1~~TRINITY_DN108032_c0_g1_i1.p1  ORF type:complete len:118 (+),score=15.02 TRINITY_DN108032_c0_g1_i1:180-533(+)
MESRHPEGHMLHRELNGRSGSLRPYSNKQAVRKPRGGASNDFRPDSLAGFQVVDIPFNSTCIRKPLLLWILPNSYLGEWETYSSSQDISSMLITNRRYFYSPRMKIAVAAGKPLRSG